MIRLFDSILFVLSLVTPVYLHETMSITSALCRPSWQQVQKPVNDQAVMTRSDSELDSKSKALSEDEAEEEVAKHKQEWVQLIQEVKRSPQKAFKILPNKARGGKRRRDRKASLSDRPPWNSTWESPEKTGI